MEIITPNKKNLTKILDSLKNGKVLVCPTNTVYGLICDAGNKKAVEKIFLIKKRQKDKSILIFTNSVADTKKIAEIDRNQEKFLNNNWPGQVTVVLKAKSGLSPLLYKEGTIGVRVPDYQFLGAILKGFKKPLAQTSANISGRGPTTQIKEILKQFGDKKIQPDIMIDAGDLPNNKPSIIVDLTDNNIKILRP